MIILFVVSWKKEENFFITVFAGKWTFTILVFIIKTNTDRTLFR